tara:strand:+ start:74 stop:406 length:333 start_codon:yes stop_codon:yes gene_type:complete
MGSWLSIEDFEEFGYESNDMLLERKHKERKIKQEILKKKISFYNLMDKKKSPKELFNLANSFYTGTHHKDNPTNVVDIRDAAYFYKKAYEKLLFYIQHLEIRFDSDLEDY